MPTVVEGDDMKGSESCSVESYEVAWARCHAREHPIVTVLFAPEAHLLLRSGSLKVRLAQGKLCWRVSKGRGVAESLIMTNDDLGI